MEKVKNMLIESGKKSQNVHLAPEIIIRNYFAGLLKTILSKCLFCYD